MAKCEICSKGPMFGHNRSHSMVATKRMFQPNVMKRNVVVNGQPRRLYVCTRCVRTMNKPKR